MDLPRGREGTNDDGGEKCGTSIEPAATAEDAELDESTTLLDALRVHLAPGPGRASRLHRLRRFVDAMKGEDPEGLTTLAVHMEKEGCPANDRRHYRLDAGKTLRECLEGKRVVEFPRLHVTVLPEDEGKFREPDA